MFGTGETRAVLRSGGAGSGAGGGAGAGAGAGAGGGRHVAVVAARGALAAPSRVALPAAPPPPGLILPDGTINWGCPCLGGMATGPCGLHFRAAFSCFHYSEADPKGSDCYEKFSEMQSCMARFPELYARDDDDLPEPPTPAPPSTTAPAPLPAATTAAAAPPASSTLAAAD